MVNVYCDVIDDEMIEVAKIISYHQKTTVTIHTSTEILEVHYEKISQEEKSSEGQTQQKS